MSDRSLESSSVLLDTLHQPLAHNYPPHSTPESAAQPPHTAVSLPRHYPAQADPGNRALPDSMYGTIKTLPYHDDPETAAHYLDPDTDSPLSHHNHTYRRRQKHSCAHYCQYRHAWHPQ